MKSCNKSKSFSAISNRKFEVAHREGIETVYKFEKSMRAMCCTSKMATTFSSAKKSEKIISRINQRAGTATKNRVIKKKGAENDRDVK